MREGGLAPVLSRNVFGREDAPEAERLAAYVRACAERLAGQAPDALSRDGPAFAGNETMETEAAG